jgi:hypothetical protein
MDTIMTKIAYKTNTTNPNLPNGFIIDHFETDQASVPGYTVVDVVTFQALLNTNIKLLRQHETNIGILAAPHDAPPHAKRPAHEAEPVDSQLMEQKKQEIKQNTQDHELFKEFLAWKRSQGQGS